MILSSLVVTGIGLAGMSGIVIGCRHHLIVAAAGCASFYILVVSPAIAGVFALSRKIITRDEPSLFDLVRGARRFLTASWLLSLSQILITSVIVANIWFYLTHGSAPMKILGILFIYALLFWAQSSIYHFPVLIEQNPGLLKTLKRGFLLALDNVGFTAGMFFVIILLTCLLGATVVCVLLLYPGLLSMVESCALRALFEKYGLVEKAAVYGADDNAASDEVHILPDLKGMH
jgi:uncharacterized membrane protein YesL